jgi:hypothetical protein
MPEPATDAIRQAASTLIAAAPASAVLAATRALLADWQLELPAATATAPGDSTPPEDRAATKASPAAPTPHADGRAAWEALRQQVRAMLPTRGVTVQALADAFGMARSTVQTALQTRAPPSRALQQRLADWLAAPEVAAEASPFRGTGTSRGHTAGHGATTRNGAGAGTDRHEAA